MGLLDVVRSAVKIADGVTKPLQSTVRFFRCTSVDKDGTRLYASTTGVPLKAIVEMKTQQLRTPNGILSGTRRASVLFLDIDALKAATKDLGVRDIDKIELPDGTTGPIMTLAGFVDAGTTLPLATEVYLG